MIFIRNTGKLCFATLRDGDGTELQAMLSLDRVGAEALEEWKRLVDLGDLVGVTGEVITSRRGELSVLADSWAMTAKALRPLPVAHKPLSEEARVRQRYVDLIVRPQAREMVRTRADGGTQPARVAVPAQLSRGGNADVAAAARRRRRPAICDAQQRTRHRSLSADRAGAIPEACVVGGIERVFEINRNFRNEGMDSTHSPEFAMLEAYQAYADYNAMQTQVREWIQEAAVAVAGSHVVTHYDGTEFDLGGEWAFRHAVRCALRGAGRRSNCPYRSGAASASTRKSTTCPSTRSGAPGKLAEELFEQLVAADACRRRRSCATTRRRRPR